MKKTKHVADVESIDDLEKYLGRPIMTTVKATMLTNDAYRPNRVKRRRNTLIIVALDGDVLITTHHDVDANLKPVYQARVRAFLPETYLFIGDWHPTIALMVSDLKTCMADIFRKRRVPSV